MTPETQALISRSVPVPACPAKGKHADWRVYVTGAKGPRSRRCWCAWYASKRVGEVEAKMLPELEFYAAPEGYVFGVCPRCGAVTVGACR